MKTLLIDKHGAIGWHLVEFKPVEKDWLSWRTHDKKLKLIHETCYFKIAMNKNEDLPYVENEGKCTLCGADAPRSIQQLVTFDTAVKDYDGSSKEI